MRTVKARTRYGDMIVAATDTYVGRSLIEYGEWSQSEIRVLEQLARPGMTVLDVGANVGYHTLALSKAVGSTGRVISFEPQPAIFQLLTANIAINDLSNVVALNMALGEERGLVDLPLPLDETPRNYGALSLPKLLETEWTGTPHVPITVQKLDDMAFTHSASLVKLDVEEMELSVLHGAQNFLKKCRPILLLENGIKGLASENLLQFLEGFGYDCYWQMSYCFNPENYARSNKNIFRTSGSINTLAIPHGSDIVIHGVTKVINKDDHPKKWSFEQFKERWPYACREYLNLQKAIQNVN